jgi:hypothetical protein
MALTDIQICNMALAHLGQTKFIASLTERSVAAELCNQFYEQARNFALEDFPWPFATKYGTLGLVEEDPNDDWTYSYRYPSDCMAVRRIVTGLGRANPKPPPFEIGADDNGRLIYTDQEDAVIRYTRLVEDAALYPAVFGEAVSWWLAGLLAPGLAKDRKQAQTAFQMYEIIKGQAYAQQLNEQQQTDEPESEFIRARE